MINSSTTSALYKYCDLETEKEKAVCDLPKPNNVDMDALLDIISVNSYVRYANYRYIVKQKSSLDDINPINNKKWKERINDEFKSIIESSLTLFASKLNKLNCGSWREKKEFLAAISGEVSSNYPFKIINDLIIDIIDKKIANVVLSHAEKAIEDIINNSCRSYDELYKIIPQKAGETLIKEDSRLGLINNIAHKISEFHKKQYRYIEKKLKRYFNIAKMPFITYIELYLNHLAENYDSMLMKSIELLYSIGSDNECCMSFAFDTFLGKMMVHNKAQKIHDIVLSSTSYYTSFELKKLLRDSVSSGKIKSFDISIVRGYRLHGITQEYCKAFRRFIERSQKNLEVRIIECLTRKDTIIIDNGTIIACDKKFMEEIVSYSIKHLEEKIISSIRQNI
ncbi:hypothetical protein [Candidatus Ichthyocystis sparus]|uniref:hypothetical protein n=1 Tax=Candidatus Ichthyocystis sparus TaxID=1561004 RepID=UPI000B833BBA|nr:hypothetical protein [Candidatus Ichthyocystis sparus]